MATFARAVNGSGATQGPRLRGKRQRDPPFPFPCRVAGLRADSELRIERRPYSKRRATLGLLILALRRLGVVLLGVVAVWLIAFVFRVTDQRLPTLLALALAYAVAAYAVLPRIVRMSLKILQRRSVPSFTLTGDGFPGDPVNVALVGTLAQLRAAFAAAGWTEADPLGIRSSWGMVVAFVMNRPYPAAPFSTLFLFGRGQDIGFQKAIDASPRKRHHVRFWALSAERAENAVNTPAFWLNADRPPAEETALWVGAGTKDTGFSLTKFTFQVTHATDSDSDAERDFIIAELKRSGVIGDVRWHQEGERVNLGKVNHYVADSEIAVAMLA